MAVRVGMQQAMRAAAVALLDAYAASAGIQLQVYPGRPRTVRPPTAFVDAINEPTITYTGLRQRLVQAEIIVIHGLYDSAEAAIQKDAFVDDFLDWVTDNSAAAEPGTMSSITATQDIPDFVPSWLPEQEQVNYYATRIVVEGLTLDRN